MAASRRIALDVGDGWPGEGTAKEGSATSWQHHRASLSTLARQIANIPRPPFGPTQRPAVLTLLDSITCQNFLLRLRPLLQGSNSHSGARTTEAVDLSSRAYSSMSLRSKLVCAVNRAGSRRAPLITLEHPRGMGKQVKQERRRAYYEKEQQSCRLAAWWRTRSAAKTFEDIDKA
ncbi:hypothetical protein LshimejAT787_0505560 [Lyophyllum shimeji]|uniref:Uncharacterized protein n=1 Tax=Lyophyllum shimeji TaxID=47721 RepID=A0A9P3PN42_LYOSH|nr:hypothetical protein LshimejAT787_0505560 [Lyophyllum shimeji]